MRHTSWIPGLLLAAAMGGAAAQQPAAGAGAAEAEAAVPAPGTGDAWVDAVLADIDAYGRRYPDAFADELARYQGAPREVVAALLATPGWTPGDVYFACALAHAIGRSCRYVADERQAGGAAGWGALAGRLGAAPGSPAFQRVRDGFADAYGRWGRPLPTPPAPSAPPAPAKGKHK